MSEYKDIVKSIVADVKETNVESIFGEPRKFGAQTIIPVGKIAYGWGGGSGKGEKEEGKHEVEQEGSGVGMGVQVKPLGYIDVTAQGAEYRPIVDYTPVVAIGAGVLGLTALRLLRGLGRRRAA